MQTPAKDIDAYLAPLPEDVRAELEKLRKTIKAAAPGAEEVISYNMPAFRFHGMLCGFAAYKNHCSFFPWGGKAIVEFKDELKGFETAKGTIRFTLEKPLPVALVKKIVKMKVKDNLEKEKRKLSKEKV